ncbi:hypothetical protein BC937DRAFT_87098 [Endogone sp. FLAS-F59071]|nr:hypothetical protein BC937DRAFT_87098 [Endogone sp. FLAS-F59071]|eukprot:RUS19688.1 hypothetical protein BC937DRAFT_87098 [Endogone sp. FLAS-F59071]
MSSSRNVRTNPSRNSYDHISYNHIPAPEPDQVLIRWDDVTPERQLEKHHSSPLSKLSNRHYRTARVSFVAFYRHYRSWYIY